MIDVLLENCSQKAKPNASEYMGNERYANTLSVWKYLLSRPCLEMRVNNSMHAAEDTADPISILWI